MTVFHPKKPEKEVISMRIPKDVLEILDQKSAQPNISRGQQLQEHFVEQLFANIDDATRQIIFQGMQQMELNLNLILEDN